MRATRGCKAKVRTIGARLRSEGLQELWLIADAETVYLNAVSMWT